MAGSDTSPIPGGSSPAPTVASSTSVVPAVASAIVAGAEIAVPALLPFNPLLLLLLTAIKAHFNAVGTFPTPEQLAAALPADWQALQATWANWTPSGDGSIK